MMRKIICFLLLCTMFMFAFEELTFSNNLERAKQDASQKSQKILLMFFQEGCPTCEYMEDIAFHDAILANHIRQNFILVKLDINKDTIPSHLKVYGTPTFYVLNPQGEKQGRPIVGGGTAEAFLKLLKTYQK